ncbi:MAG: kinase [Croceibacterium sp.]
MNIAQLIADQGLPADYAEVVEAHWVPLAGRIAASGARLVGINGAQGSGKSTLCKFLEPLLAERGLHAVTLSLDDLYLTKSERHAMACDEHRLFATRGVPGTHDVLLGEAILDAVAGRRAVTLPRFDKAADDRASDSRAVVPPVDVVLFEGWCIGAVPQPATAFRRPINTLEADEDPDGTWRREVNRRLATDYATLFDRIDMLIMLEVGSFDAVLANRRLQEHKLAAANPAGVALLDDDALDRFLMHYERLTRWMLDEMPSRADIVITIGEDQRPC